MPEAWAGERLRLVAGGRIVANTENAAGERVRMTNLVADDPRTGQPIVIAEDMERIAHEASFEVQAAPA